MSLINQGFARRLPALVTKNLLKSVIAVMASTAIYIRKEKINNMTIRIYLFISGIAFLLLALFHALRLIFLWDTMIAGWEIPMWMSWVGSIAALCLAFFGFKLREK